MANFFSKLIASSISDFGVKFCCPKSTSIFPEIEAIKFDELFEASQFHTSLPLINFSDFCS